MGLDESGGTSAVPKSVSSDVTVTLIYKDGRPAETYRHVFENYIDGGFLVLLQEMLQKKQTTMISLDALDRIRVEDMPEPKTDKQRIIPIRGI